MAAHVHILNHESQENLSFFFCFYKVISDLSLCRFAVFGHPRLQCVGFAPQCGKHLLKGFQVQFGFGWTSQLISLPPLWHGITTIQEQNFPRTKKEKKRKLLRTKQRVHFLMFSFHTTNLPAVISVDCSVTIILSVDYALIEHLWLGDCSRLSVKLTLMSIK